MTVFISQQPLPNKHNWVPDLGPAAKYGDLKFIFQGEEQPYIRPQQSLSHAIRTLKQFEYERDFLLWPNTGDVTAMWCAIIALMLLGVEKIQFLYWHKPRGNKAGHYAPMQFTLKEFIHGIKNDSQAS